MSVGNKALYLARRGNVEDVKKILVVSRDTKDCRKAVHYGVSLAKKFGASLYVIHVLHDPFIFGGWNLPIPAMEEEYKKVMAETQKELHAVIESEKKHGMSIQELIKEGNPTEELFKVIKEENIDLLVLLAHEEWHLEHFLFGRSNEEIIRRMPCSVLMVKKEPKPVAF